MVVNKLDEAWIKQPPPPPSASPVTPIFGRQASKYGESAMREELAAIASTPVGTRNGQLNKSAFSLGTLVGAGVLDYADVREALVAAGLAAGLTEHETVRTVASGLQSGVANPRQLPESASGGSATGGPDGGPDGDHHPVTVLGPIPGWSRGKRGSPAPDFTGGAASEAGDGTEDSNPSPGATDPPDVVENETTFWESREVLTHVFAFARARRVSPWAVLGVVLARITTAAPPTYVLPPIVGGTASLNQFVALVGTSGSGKGAASAVAAEAVVVVNTVDQELVVVKTGSGEGIAHGFMRKAKDGRYEMFNTAVLFDVPEIDTLTALGGRQGATLLPELRSGWSGEPLGFAYADPAKRLAVPAHRYRMCLVAGVQPGRADALLGDSDAGTPQRFLWLPAADPDAPDVTGDAPEPWKWVRPRWGELTMTGRRYGEGEHRRTAMPVCQEAKDTIIEARLARLRGDGHALDGHGLLARLKVAASLAMLDSRYDVTDEDWRLAGMIAAKSDATRAGVVATLADAIKAGNRGKALAEADRTIIVTERLEDVAVRRVCRVIVRHLTSSADWTPAGALRKVVTSRDRRYFPLAIDRLLDAGQVEVQTVTNRVQYRMPG